MHGLGGSLADDKNPSLRSVASGPIGVPYVDNANILGSDPVCVQQAIDAIILGLETRGFQLRVKVAATPAFEFVGLGLLGVPPPASAAPNL